MTRQAISTGSSPNDGTGDTLRQAATKINDNFEELYLFLGGDSDQLSSSMTLGSSSVSFSDPVSFEKVVYTPSTITANGAASADDTYIVCNKATALAVTLADGTSTGEVKIFTNQGAGTASITPANLASSSTVIQIEQYESVSLIWDGSNWYVTGGYGYSLS